MFSLKHSFPLLRTALCALLCLSPIVAGSVKNAHAQPMRAADPAPLGQTVHFTLDKEEQKDLAITLAPGNYYITTDVKRVDGEDSNIFVGIDLLKTNGALVKSRILGVNETTIVFREGSMFSVEKPFATAAKPLAARLRVKGQSMALEYWITVQPVAKRTFIPLGFANGDMKPMAIGTENGKGGALDGHEWAFHKITLPPGKYNVSLYMKQGDGKSTNIFGEVVMLDQYGVVNKNPSFNFHINETDVETRKEEKLRLLKPQTVIFRVDNTNSKAMDYTLGIEKDTD